MAIFHLFKMERLVRNLKVNGRFESLPKENSHIDYVWSSKLTQ